ncbi:hypothetical protein HY643_02110 [Candidatus Woesearchaeota archaeon]|nr:hypothetical protein [Candidatus Woesearchaeota archaeon]
MNFAVIVSEKDLAGLNIKECLIRLHNFKKCGEKFLEKDVYASKNVKLYTVGEETVFCENIDEKIGEDCLVFATRHQSAAGKHSLSVHVPGNWGKAEFGGENGRLCIAPASLLKQMFLELNKNSIDGYEVTLECTHHGPLLKKKPAMFIEIGSSEDMWKKKIAGETIAKTIMNVLAQEIKNFKTAIALGSTHYPPAFNKALLKTDFAISHICPKHMLHLLTEDLLKQAVEKADKKAEFALLDWKGLGQHKKFVTDLLEKIGLPYQRTHNLPG